MCKICKQPKCNQISAYTVPTICKWSCIEEEKTLNEQNRLCDLLMRMPTRLKDLQDLWSPPFWLSVTKNCTTKQTLISTWGSHARWPKKFVPMNKKQLTTKTPLEHIYTECNCLIILQLYSRVNTSMLHVWNPTPIEPQSLKLHMYPPHTK